MERPTVKIINSSMVLVSWKPPLNPGGHLNYYEVTAIKVDEKSVKNETYMYNTSGMRHHM
jgi:Fibronectin type III domain.